MTFRKFKDERGDGRAAAGPYPGPPLQPLGGASSPEPGEVEMHGAGRHNGAAGVRGPSIMVEGPDMHARLHGPKVLLLSFRW